MEIKIICSLVIKNALIIITLLFFLFYFAIFVFNYILFFLGLWLVIIIWNRRSRMLPTGRPYFVQTLQCQADSNIDHKDGYRAVKKKERKKYIYTTFRGDWRRKKIPNVYQYIGKEYVFLSLHFSVAFSIISKLFLPNIIINILLL